MITKRIKSLQKAINKLSAKLDSLEMDGGELVEGINSELDMLVSDLDNIHSNAEDIISFAKDITFFLK